MSSSSTAIGSGVSFPNDGSHELGSDQHVVANLVAIVEGMTLENGVRLMLGAVVTLLGNTSDTAQEAATNTVRAASALMHMAPAAGQLHKRAHAK